MSRRPQEPETRQTPAGQGPATGSPGAGQPHPARRSHLDELVGQARLTLVWERLWPALWPPIGVAALFVTFALGGLFVEIGPMARAVVCGLFALALLGSLVPLARLRPPRRSEALERIDRDNPGAHRPASTLDDRLALGEGDPAAQALWALHRKRAEAAIAEARVSAPHPGMAARDPLALRAAVLLLLVASAFVAGPDVVDRLRAAFDWRGLEAPGPSVRLDGWIDPPLYTRLPPLVLDFRATGEAARIKVPVNSTLVIRAGGTSEMIVDRDAGLAPLPAARAPRRDIAEQRFTVTGDATLAVAAGGSSGRLKLQVVPDHAPTIAFSGPPQANARGSMVVAYRARDDYGLASVEGIVERAGEARGRVLVEPPRMPLALPAADAGEDADTRTTVDLSQSPWAGASVKMTLVARDEAGQEGRSQTIETVLPQRPFSKPLARALVEQRRNLVLEPERRDRVEAALAALLIAPERFTPELGVYLGLRFGEAQVRGARTDADMLAAADFLWEMALRIEDGDLSEAEKALRAAQEALKQALERGAGEDEIRRLTDELRQAIDRFVSEFAQQQQKRGGERADRRASPDARVITPDDLKRMLDQMEALARDGATADAQQMLDRLRDILENLRSAEQGRQQNPLAREFDRTLDELDDMIREQQGLRDDTYRSQPGPQFGPHSGRPQRGERGQRGEPQAGPNGEQQGADGLNRRQQALRERLEALQRRLKGFGMEGEQGFADAEGAMREAEESLGQGQSGEAVEQQGRALEGMRQGVQGLAQQMQNGAEGSGEAGDPDGPGRSNGRAQSGADSSDPLGRPTRSRDWVDGRVKIPGASESAVARVRRILDELRRRLGEPDRPQGELDYIERLLRQR